jgi:hypothetical protein
VADEIDGLRSDIASNMFGAIEESLDEEYNPKNPKIDLFHNGDYHASTNWSPNTKHAIDRLKEKSPNLTGTITASYADGHKKTRFGTNESVSELTEAALDEMSDEEFNELVENYEQLDELSKGTLAMYVKKAHHAGGMASFRQGKAVGNAGTFHKKPDTVGAKKAGFVSDKREAGINKAVNRLSK